jgi:hypothetical protein
MLTATKRTPGSPRSRGYRLLPQSAGSFDPGGVGVSGDGNAARIGPIQIKNLSARAFENTLRLSSTLAMATGPTSMFKVAVMGY